MTNPTRTGGVIGRRPAETAAATTGVGGLIAALATHNTLAAIIAAIGAVPAAVTYLATHGGIKGVVKSIVG